jgi:hypothetical protein
MKVLAKESLCEFHMKNLKCGQFVVGDEVFQLPLLLVAQISRETHPRTD